MRSTRTPSVRTCQTDMGGLDALKKTLAEDPAGFAADIGGLLTGGRRACRPKPLERRVRVGKVAKAVGSARQAAKSAVGKGAKAVGSGVAEVLGVTTGASSQPIKMAYQAGKGKGRERKLIEDSMKGKTPQAAVVKFRPRKPLKTLKAQKNERFIKMRQEVFGEGAGRRGFGLQPDSEEAG